MNKYLLIGEVLKPQGVKGDVKVRPITCDIFRFEDLDEVFFVKDGEYSPIGVSLVRMDEDAVYLHFDGIDDRNQAETIRGNLLYVDRAHAVELEEDENFIVDLIGLKGVDDEGNEYGKLVDVMQPGGNDVYVFRDRRREVLVPALKTAILKVDLEAGVMLMSAKRLREVAVFDEV
ncbi:MAG: 16S rRNA processing protein RimM [Clostridiales bacterium]|nr:16S rRNA processing protein RimM [Clostridiales bacterium]